MWLLFINKNGFTLNVNQKECWRGSLSTLDNLKREEIGVIPCSHKDEWERNVLEECLSLDLWFLAWNERNSLWREKLMKSQEGAQSTGG